MFGLKKSRKNKKIKPPPTVLRYETELCKVYSLNQIAFLARIESVKHTLGLDIPLAGCRHLYKVYNKSTSKALFVSLWRLNGDYESYTHALLVNYGIQLSTGKVCYSDLAYQRLTKEIDKQYLDGMIDLTLKCVSEGFRVDLDDLLRGFL